MRKTFLQLLAELKRLGTQVVYADFTRIFLLTSKPDAGSAFAFSQYLVTAANSQELFRHLTIEVTQFWNYLAWLDVANYGGIRITPEQASSRQLPSRRFEISMDWNIQAFLPPTLQPVFERTVANFIFNLYQAKLKANDGRTPLRMIHNLDIDKPGEAAKPLVNPAKEKENAAAQQSISHLLTRKLLSEVANVKKRQAAAALDPAEEAALAFPVLPGSHLEGRSPALELVKAVTEVYSLASEHSVEVGILKRNLLDLVGVREFSSEAAFKNPCDSLVLPMVICGKCNALRDIDLSRDPDRLPTVDQDTGEVLPPARKTWICQVRPHTVDLC
jgi:DNA polymerase epsilon subunit 1